MSKINFWEDEIQKLKGLKVGDEFTLIKQFHFSGKNGFCAKKHLGRVRPIGKVFWVAEDISFYRLEGSNNRLGSSQEGYTADVHAHTLNWWVLDSKSYCSSNMPKAFSRFKVKVVSHGEIWNDSTSWFSASVVFKLVEKVE